MRERDWGAGEGQKDKQAGRKDRRDRLTDRQTDRQTHRETERQTERLRERERTTHTSHSINTVNTGSLKWTAQTRSIANYICHTEATRVNFQITNSSGFLL